MTIGHKISEAREDALKEGIGIGIDKGRVKSNEQNDKILLVLLGNPKATNSEISAITGANDERINKIRDIINQSKA